MALEDVSSDGSVGFVRRVERIGEDGLSLMEIEKTKMIEKAHNIVILSLGDKVLRHISKEKTLVGV